MKISIVYLICAAVFSSIGNLVLKFDGENVKQASMFSKIMSPYFIAASFFFFINLVFFSKALSSLPVSLAYPILSSISLVLVTIGALVIFNERLTVVQYSGVLAIGVGIALLSSGIR